ncbi:hypothetical protein FRC03_003381 [Tulasnella sp. 419]|nr:hypothetical protein FRC03_003381 [Tulasnella sp. 419]
MSSRASNSRSGGPSRGARGGRGGRGRGGRGRGTGNKPIVDTLPGPLHSNEYLMSTFDLPEHLRLKPSQIDNPKSLLFNYMGSNKPVFAFTEGVLGSRRIVRASTTIRAGDVDVIAVGDSNVRKEAEKLAALSACLQLAQLGKFTEKPREEEVAHATLSDGKEVSLETAKLFLKYYCRRFKYASPVITTEEGRERNRQVWKATIVVNGNKIGMGVGSTKKKAEQRSYLDMVEYLEGTDRSLWLHFEQDSRSKEHNMGPEVLFTISEQLKDQLRQCNDLITKTTLYANSTRIKSTTAFPTSSTASTSNVAASSSSNLHSSYDQRFFDSKQSSKPVEDPQLKAIRQIQASLPVNARAQDIIDQLERDDISILMAATGSGKTSQLPQIILDDWIKKGKGTECHIICTQPRRIAAISVAHRIAKERGEVIGDTVGYQVRFESKLPRRPGNIVFCTTGVFLKRMQSALQVTTNAGGKMDHITHIMVDEVHERDIDTDLILVVLKRLLADRKARRIPLKIVLASATIDPTLFQNYFAKEDGSLARVIDIPGRSFPVVKHFLGDFLPTLRTQAGSTSAWVFSDKIVMRYILREEDPSQGRTSIGPSRPSTPTSFTSEATQPETELDIPSPLVALTIAWVLSKSHDGHVLVFLPGWDEIMAVQRVLLDTKLPLLNIDFNNASRYAIHLLHSTIPIEEQQAVFEPAMEGIRRIILATNIAETSITIPDVVYVVDTAKIKEKRYDPQRHISSLVSAWVGKSNINQRAGRAGPLKKEALAAKERFTPTDFKSDTLASLNGYNEWERMVQERRPYSAIQQFLMENFLSRLTLQAIQKIKGHLLLSLRHAGVLDVSGGGSNFGAHGRGQSSLPELNVHGDSLPLLAGLIVTACQPNFAVRTSPHTYQTGQDKATYMHSRSVNHRKRESKQEDGPSAREKQLYTFQEKSQNATISNAKPQTMLRNVTRIDLLTYMLFGAYHLTPTETHLECDEWLPVVGDIDGLLEIQRLKMLMESCLLRVFDGICFAKASHKRQNPHRPGVYIAPGARSNLVDDWEEMGYDLDDRYDAATPLAEQEIKELDDMATSIVHLLNAYREERSEVHSAASSRPATPSIQGGTPNYSPLLGGSLRLPPLRGNTRPGSGYSTPYYLSRPATPSGLARFSGLPDT